jgi:hypothetical protein
MSNRTHPVPKTDRERRLRYVQMQRVAAGEIDVPEDPAACARRPTTRAQRRRICEVLALEAGVPVPTWGAARGKPEPIDDGPLKAAWHRVQSERVDSYAAYDIALEKRGSRARCTRCGETLMDVPHGMVGVTPSALYVMHFQRTGCR